MRTAESRKGGHAQAVCGARCGPGGGRREAGGGRGPLSFHREGRDTAEMGQGTAGCGAHVERAIHVRDFGGLPVIQRLIERRRALPRVEKGAYGGMRCEVREAGGGRRPRRTQRAGKSQTDYAVRVRSESTGRGAHVEHELHTLDAGGIPEVQRLIERRRALPRVEKGAYCGMRLVVRAACGRREAGDDRGTRRVQDTGPDCAGMGKGMGGAHDEHAEHVSHAGGVPVRLWQLLIERRRSLPKVEGEEYGAGGARCEPGAGRRRATTRRTVAACRAGPDCRYGSESTLGRSARRTWTSCL